MLLIRLLSLLWIGGSIYWVWREPTETEPKVSLVGALFSLVTFFWSPKKPAEVFISFKNESSETQKYKFMLWIENRGESDAKDFSVTFPPNFPSVAGEIETIPKVFRPSEIKKIRVILSLGSPHEFELRWSWRGSMCRRHERKSVVQLE